MPYCTDLFVDHINLHKLSRGGNLCLKRPGLDSWQLTHTKIITQSPQLQHWKCLNLNVASVKKSL